MSFWDVVWFILITYALVALLMVMFSIITDMFRDKEMSGFVKAVWIFALVFLPVVTALVYLIVRGNTATNVKRPERKASNKKTLAATSPIPTSATKSLVPVGGTATRRATSGPAISRTEVVREATSGQKPAPSVI